jgi:hypothetical protein
MAFIADAAFDAALDYVRTNGTRIDFCTTEPGTYAAATSTNTVANETGITLTANAAGSPNGRRLTIPDTVSATVTADGTATHWALTDGASELVATGALDSGVAVLVGGGSNTLDLSAAIPIEIADAVAI